MLAGLPGLAFIVRNLHRQAVPSAFGIVADQDPMTVAERHDLRARARIGQLGIGDRRPGLAAIARFTLLKPFRRRTIIAHERVERPIFAADDTGLDVPATDQGRAGFPGLAPVISNGHQ